MVRPPGTGTACITTKAHAKAKQLPGLLIDGQAFGAVFAREAMRWAGPQAFLARMGLEDEVHGLCRRPPGGQRPGHGR
jgi:hypothetical protein